MTFLVLCTWLVGWGLGMLLRRAVARTTPDAPVKRRRDRVVLSTGLEDDPTQWPPAAVRGEWTELDERQLTRLLTDSASGIHQPKPPSAHPAADGRAADDADSGSG